MRFEELYVKGFHPPLSQQEEAAVERLLANREEQGLPRFCSDPLVLAEIADILKLPTQS